MGRQRLRRAAHGGTVDGPALVPLIERHLGSLIGVAGSSVTTDVDVALRAFRMAAGLYAVDGLTLGAEASWLGRAVESAAAATGLTGADRAAVDPELASQPAVGHVRTLVGRLRAGLADGVGIVVVLPGPDRLVGDVGIPGASAEWATAVLLAAVRAIGPEEPDAFLLRAAGPTAVGIDEDRSSRATIEAAAAHFGVPLISLDADGAGVLVVPSGAFDGSTELGPVPLGTRLITTDDELPEAAEPGRIRAAIQAIRATMGVAA